MLFTRDGLVHFGNFNDLEIKEMLQENWKLACEISLENPNINRKYKPRKVIKVGVGKNGIPIVQMR